MSIYSPNKDELDEHLSSSLDYQSNEANIISLLSKRSQTIKDYLDVSSSGESSNYSGASGINKQLSDIDSNIEATWGNINSNIQNIYATKGMHNQNLVQKNNKGLDNVVKKANMQSRALKEIQQDIGSISGEKDDSSLSVKAYNFQYYIFILLTLLIIITTIISFSKSESSMYEWVILAFFCLLIIYRFYDYLKDNLSIWWNSIKDGSVNGVKGMFI